MCVTVLTIPVLFTAGALLTGSGRAHFAGLAMVLHLLVLFVAVPPLAKTWGVVGAAFGDLTAMSSATTVLFLTARRATGQNHWSLREAILAPGIAALLSAFLAYVIGSGIEATIWRAITEGCVIGCGYVAALIAFGGKTRLNELIALLRGIAPRIGVSSRETASVDTTLERVEVRS